MLQCVRGLPFFGIDLLVSWAQQITVPAQDGVRGDDQAQPHAADFGDESVEQRDHCTVGPQMRLLQGPNYRGKLRHEHLVVSLCCL
jgi:hypothetical protein